jgi:hypothetical protein
LTFRDDREGQDQSRSASDAKTPASARGKTGTNTGAKTGERRARRRPPGGEVGLALRTVYDDTLKESIPPEMLDLLGKLG